MENSKTEVPGRRGKVNRPRESKDIKQDER
jgi:hypothetical protein